MGALGRWQARRPAARPRSCFPAAAGCFRRGFPTRGGHVPWRIEKARQDVGPQSKICLKGWLGMRALLSSVRRLCQASERLGVKEPPGLARPTSQPHHGLTWGPRTTDPAASSRPGLRASHDRPCSLIAAWPGGLASRPRSLTTAWPERSAYAGPKAFWLYEARRTSIAAGANAHTSKCPATR